MAEGCQYNRPFVQHIAVSHMEQEGQHSTAQSSPTWYKGNSAQHSTAQDGTAGHGIAQHSTAQHSTAPYVNCIGTPATSDLLHRMPGV